MNNLEWLYEHERDKLVKLLTGEYISCDMCYYRHDYPDCGGDCERNVREWLDDVHSEQIPDKGEHAETPHASKWQSNDAQDSREKLEADMRERLGELWADAWDAGNRDSMDDNFDLSVFIALLDRQAAIDRKEFETILEEIQECMRNGSR